MSTYLLPTSLVEAVVVAKERIAAGHAGVTLEHAVRAQPSSDSRLGQIGTGQRGLPTDAEEVGNEISVDEESSIGEEARQLIVHVEA